jgi:hypothetical protein
MKNKQSTFPPNLTEDKDLQNHFNQSSDSTYFNFGSPYSSFQFPPPGGVHSKDVHPTGKSLIVFGHSGSLVMDVEAPPSSIGKHLEDVHMAITHQDLGIPDSQCIQS